MPQASSERLLDPDRAGGGPAAVPAGAQETVVLSVLVVLQAIVLWPYRHFAGDDAYITFRFVQNLSNGLGYSFNSGVPTYGSTAPLWVFLLSALHKAGIRIEDAAHALNWIFSLANVVLMWLWVRKYVSNVLVRAIFLLFFIFDPWIVRWAMSGMENSFALSLLLATLLRSGYSRNNGRLDWLTPVLLGLASLTRPEMILLAGLVGADLLLRERKRLIGNLVVLVVLYTMILAPWLIYAHRSFGTVVPNTVIAKLSKNQKAAVVGTVKFFLSFWPVQLLGLAALPFVVGRIDWRSPAVRRYRAELGVAIAWAVGLPLFYIVGGAPVSGRYLMYVTPCYLLFGAMAGERLWQRGTLGVIAGSVATLLLLVVVQYRYCWFVTRWPEGMDPKMIDMARDIKAQAPPGSMIACDQIGVMGYFSELTILDTLGLVSPEVLPYRRAKDPRVLYRYMRDRKADFLFITDSAAYLRGMDPAYEDVKLIRSEAVQREGAGSADAKTVYNVYKTNWHAPTL